jgi:hypothetical protein
MSDRAFLSFCQLSLSCRPHGVDPKLSRMSPRPGNPSGRGARTSKESEKAHQNLVTIRETANEEKI